MFISTRSVSSRRSRARQGHVSTSTLLSPFLAGPMVDSDFDSDTDYRPAFSASTSSTWSAGRLATKSVSFDSLDIQDLASTTSASIRARIFKFRRGDTLKGKDKVICTIPGEGAGETETEIDDPVSCTWSLSSSFWPDAFQANSSSNCATSPTFITARSTAANSHATALPIRPVAQRRPSTNRCWVVLVLPFPSASSIHCPSCVIHLGTSLDDSYCPSCLLHVDWPAQTLAGLLSTARHAHTTSCSAHRYRMAIDVVHDDILRRAASSACRMGTRWNLNCD